MSNPCKCKFCVVPSLVKPVVPEVKPVVPAETCLPSKSPVQCPSDNKSCCNVYNQAYGRIIQAITQASKHAQSEAFISAGNDAAKIQAVTDRLPALRGLGAESSVLVGTALSETHDIPEDCCEGYALALESGVSGVFSYAAANIFILSIPLGQPSDPATPLVPPQIGTVYGNSKRAVEQLAALIARARYIASNC